MATPTPESLTQAKCVPCEGGVPQLTPGEAADYCLATPQWTLDDQSLSISRKFNCGNFVKAVALIEQIAEVSETQQHHPDLHLTGYRHLKVVLTTHAIKGLSENDFIVAAQIDQLLSE
ncbi:MAG: 4a-hydroxytetrahydrobiopterin dehydratase [Planctomycetota bacterium]